MEVESDQPNFQNEQPDEERKGEEEDDEDEDDDESGDEDGYGPLCNMEMQERYTTSKFKKEVHSLNERARRIRHRLKKNLYRGEGEEAKMQRVLQEVKILYIK